MTNFDFKIRGSATSAGRFTYTTVVRAAGSKGAFLRAYDHFKKVEGFEAQMLRIVSSEKAS